MLKLGYSKAFTYTMIAAMGWSTWSLVHAPPSLGSAITLTLTTLLITDLISGLLHVVLDNPRSLALGPIRGLAEGFQRHHENPANIYKMPLYQHLYVMHMPLTLLFLVALPFNDAGMHVVFLSLVVGLHIMQMAHRWAHLPAETLHPGVRLLQNARILLSTLEHDRHHTPPYDRNFCIMTGTCNRPLNLAVAALSPTTHWWLAIFVGTALSPLVLAFVLARL